MLDVPERQLRKGKNDKLPFPQIDASGETTPQSQPSDFLGECLKAVLRSSTPRRLAVPHLNYVTRFRP